MSTAWQAWLVTGLLFLAVLVATEIGWRWGRAERRKDPTPSDEGLSPIASSVFSLMGLLFAFTFGAGQTRFESRRQQILLEHTEIGTAYQRLDLLPVADQPELREDFRAYFDARLAVYDRMQDLEATRAAIERKDRLFDRLWMNTARACDRGKRPSLHILLLNPMNAMGDAGIASIAGLDAHTAAPVLLLLLLVSPISGLLAGRSMSDRKRRSPAHILLFSLVVAATFYAIVDLDSARFGLIRLRGEHRLLVELRETMR